MKFERWFRERTSRFERLLIKGVGLMLFILFVAQALLTQPNFRLLLSLVDKHEGTAISEEESGQPAISRPVIDDQERFVRLSIINDVDGEGIDVLVNGEVVATFGSSESVLIPVHDGDQVEVDGEIPAEDVIIAVTSVSEGILSPVEGKQITYFGQPETVSFITIGEGNKLTEEQPN
ncbi:MAG: hypothetical protein GX922_07585 [Firmicutes bacterium]|nr:hypothetical protein [Bacillota bacterium]